MASASLTGVVPDHVPAGRVVDFDIYNPVGIEEGFQESWTFFQRPEIPEIVWSPYNGGHWIATRGETIRHIFRDPAHFSNEVNLVPRVAGEKMATFPNRLDPPEHGPYRAALDKGLKLQSVRHMDEDIRAIARNLIAPIAPAGECHFTKAYAEVFPVHVFLTLADLPLADTAMLKDIAAQITRPEAESDAEAARLVDEASKAFHAYVNPVLDKRKGGDGTDILSRAINTPVNGEPITRDQALRMITLLLLGGLDTVVNFLGFLMNHLATNPDTVKALVAEPERIPRMVEEFFRRFPVVSIARSIAADVELDGVTMKKGDMIVLPTALHNLDPQANEDPLAVRFDRGSLSHSTFGEGPHRCAGLHLARLEVTVTLQEWLKKIPEFRLASDARPTHHSGLVASVDDVRLEW